MLGESIPVMVVERTTTGLLIEMFCVRSPSQASTGSRKFCPVMVTGKGGPLLCTVSFGVMLRTSGGGGVGVGEGVNVWVGDGVMGVSVGVTGVHVGEGVGVGMGVHVEEGVGVGTGVHVGEGVGVGVGVHVGVSVVGAGGVHVSVVNAVIVASKSSIFLPSVAVTLLIVLSHSIVHSATLVTRTSLVSISFTILISTVSLISISLVTLASTVCFVATSCFRSLSVSRSRMARTVKKNIIRMKSSGIIQGLIIGNQVSTFSRRGSNRACTFLIQVVSCSGLGFPTTFPPCFSEGDSAC
jgi:hypothetical protein